MTAKKRFALTITALLVLTGFSAAAYHYGKKYSYQKDILKAAEEGKRGFWALAAEKVDRHRFDMLSNENDCNTLLNVYANAKKGERLEWAAQACLEAGVENFGVYLSLSIAQELLGRDQEAIQLLDQIIKKFEKEPTAYRRLAMIFSRNKDEARATEIMYLAATRTQDAQICLDALQALLNQKRIAEALTLAQILKTTPTENPEVKLIVARALIAGKEATGGSAQNNEAKFLMEKLDPVKKSQLEKQYADVLKTSKSKLK